MNITGLNQKPKFDRTRRRRIFIVYAAALHSMPFLELYS